MPREGRKMKCGWYPTTQHAMPRKRCCSTVSFSGGPSATIISGRMNGRRLCFLQFGWVVLALRLSCCPAFKLHPSSVQTRMSHRFSSRRSFVAHQSRSLDIFDRWSSPSELRASGSFEGTALGVENHGETSGRGDNVADGLIPSANGARRRWISASVRFPRFGLSKRRRRVLEEEASAPPVYRSVRETLPLLRLPVWPAQNGLIFILLDLLRLKTLATKLEDLWGGRVGVLIPKNPGESDPFVLFAHHRHSFWPLDPFRPLLRLILDEGFPAHPHRGFQTVTYVMKGGITHRDSMGLKQSYGAGEVQWMNAGRGLMHEEMWKIEDWAKTDIEIYQIWVNVPSKLKMTRPRIQLAGGNTRESPPLPVVQPSKGTEVVVIAGELCNEISPIEPMLPCSMLHVKMEAGADPWEFAIPEGSQVFIYVRQGDLTLVPTEEGYFEGEEDRGPQEIPHREAALLAFDGNFVRFENRGEAPLDFLLMEAEPTREEIAVRASFVMNTEEELDRAAADLNQGAFGRSWDHRLSDEEWRESLQGATGKRTSYGSGDWR